MRWRLMILAFGSGFDQVISRPLADAVACSSSAPAGGEVQVGGAGTSSSTELTPAGTSTNDHWTSREPGAALPVWTRTMRPRRSSGGSIDGEGTETGNSVVWTS